MTLNYLLKKKKLDMDVSYYNEIYKKNKPFRHVIIDNFLDEDHINFLIKKFPKPDHLIWLDWKKRAPNQFGKQGAGNSDNFSLLDDDLYFALMEFNSSKFLSFLKRLTGIDSLIPDPYFTGAGFHQILKGGILDIHTDFNLYKRLNLYRRINVIIYLNENWIPQYNGQLELWTGDKDNGKCEIQIEPIKNRFVVFNTNKTSFHGHPVEWNAPNEITRKSIALYYYTSEKEVGERYDELTDFQNISSKDLPT
tara:strand:+ start:323 stop:1075 length:753 start_codon:yes stop_codon:yes gene_type:complete